MQIKEKISNWFAFEIKDAVGKYAHRYGTQSEIALLWKTSAAHFKTNNRQQLEG